MFRLLDRKRPDINLFSGLPDFDGPEPGNKKRRLPEIKTPISRIYCNLRSTNVHIVLELNPKMQLSQERGIDVNEKNFNNGIIVP